ncbi:sensor histidine kinase [Microbacterium sp. p3-SID336]|uniref:sensor histidine kinase n=1 Tax=Microbacterium sp. p3-SID336 TaxID=2916212 RepID=UPI0021A25D50|nr:sensor histidine kinase [Microbacterium sp. p3-SID336]MCT1478715.1 sensor histidine kinase [Microbacterium sp. p3-SID336]
MTSMSLTQIERREQQLLRLLAVAPYLLLATSATLSMITGTGTWGDRLISLGLVLLTAVWMWTMSTRRPGGAVYVTGLLVLIALLCSRDMWFAGFFGFVGYLHSWQYLRGAWRFVGVIATAAISVTTFTGGLPGPAPAAILVHVLFIVAIVAVVGLFSSIGDVTREHSAERKRMVARLEETIRENEGLQAQLLVQAREAGVLDERQRIAREIHDTIAQGLTGVITQLHAADRAIEVGGDGSARRYLGIATALARESLAEARRSVHAVGPPELESTRLPDAIAAAASEWSGRQGVPVEVNTTGDVRPLHPEAEVTLLRVAQEALTNAGKHARASRVGLTLSYMDDVVTLDVRDDGIGFEPADAGRGGGFGLTSMRQRMDRVAGSLEIESGPEQGTAVSASIPVLAPEPSEERRSTDA